jgi:hypothetical protein
MSVTVRPGFSPAVAAGAWCDGGSEMVMEHFDGDECVTYDPEFELTVAGYRNPVAAVDIEVGDFVRHPVSLGWVEVYGTWVNYRGDVHLFFVDATAAEVAQARRDACEGHETTRGAIGDTYYCDGSCV